MVLDVVVGDVVVERILRLDHRHCSWSAGGPTDFQFYMGFEVLLK